MLGEKLETLLLALSICAVSIIVLLGGMNLSAMRSNRNEKIEQSEQTGNSPTQDVLDEVISEFSEDALRAEFSGVGIITWDEYYEMSGFEIKDENRRGVYGTVNDQNCTMKWAGLLALKELSYIENIDTEGMYLMMVLSDATSTQTLDIWRGYLCNYLIGQTPTDGVSREYYMQVNAYTGEVIRIEKRTPEGKLRTLFDTSSKMDVTGKEPEVDYSAVPILTIAEYWQTNSVQQQEYYRYGADGYMPMQEAGNIVLKEIHEVFHEDMLDMKLVMNFSDGKWGGWLLNEYDAEDERYKCYTFRMDARTGKIWWLTGGREKIAYTGEVSFTDEEIVENVRDIVKKNRLANVETLNWNKVKVYNVTKDKKALEEKLKYKNVRITNYVEFYTDDDELVQIATDWETGELWSVLYKDYQYLEAVDVRNSEMN